MSFESLFSGCCGREYGDPEYQSRLEAERVTREFREKSERNIDSGKQPITESPLFGGPAQGDLFQKE